MLKKFKSIVTSIVAIAAFAAPMAVPAMASAAADIPSNLCAGASLSTTTCDAQSAGSDAATKVDGIIATVINIFSLVVGIVAVIMIIVGGLKYITSGGDSGNVTGAKNTILYAVIGLVVVALAQFIVKFVLGKATA